MHGVVTRVRHAVWGKGLTGKFNQHMRTGQVVNPFAERKAEDWTHNGPASRCGNDFARPAGAGHIGRRVCRDDRRHGAWNRARGTP